MAAASAAACALLIGCSGADQENRRSEAARGAGATAPAAAGAAFVQASSPIEAGRYIAVVGGCNDCHTPGWDVTGGQIPERDWLVGTQLGWQGPWGTTYPRNLRLLVQNTTEDAFVQMLHTRKALPPMPWMNVNRMSEQDARALYKFIHSLGPGGEPSPETVPPGQTPKTPYIVVAPPTMPGGAKAADPATGRVPETAAARAAAGAPGG
jgi:hypothetical protein